MNDAAAVDAYAFEASASEQVDSFAGCIGIAAAAAVAAAFDVTASPVKE